MLVRVLGDQSGLSLVEIVISLALLSLVGVGLTLGFSAASLAVGQVSERNRAVHLAESQLEIIKASTIISTTLDAEVPGPYSTPAIGAVGYVVTNTTMTKPIRDQDDEVVAIYQIVTATVSYGGADVFELTSLKTGVMP